MIYNYCIEQFCVWSMFHAAFLFWSVNFPFSYRQLRISGRIHYAHIISVLLALTLPLPGALVHLKDGYLIAFNFNPTIFCAGRNADYNYHTFYLPLSVFLCVTSCLLVLTCWTLFKVGKYNPPPHQLRL